MLDKLSRRPKHKHQIILQAGRAGCLSTQLSAGPADLCKRQAWKPPRYRQDLHCPKPGLSNRHLQFSSPGCCKQNGQAVSLGAHLPDSKAGIGSTQQLLISILGEEQLWKGHKRQSSQLPSNAPHLSQPWGRPPRSCASTA